MGSFIYDYFNFPAWQDSCEGMEVIEGDKENIYCVHQVVQYAVKDDYALHIHFLFPETLDSSRKYPLIMHVRGSSWLEQNMTGLLAAYVPIVKAGIAIAFVQYRPVTVAKFPAQILDLKTAARFIKEQSDLYPIDMDNIFLAGDSSGGHTAVLGFLTWNKPELDNIDETAELPELRGLIDYYGVTDVGKLAHTETGYSQETNAQLGDALFELPAEEHPEEYEAASAFSYIDLRERLEPVLILHGNKDRLVPLGQSVELFKALKGRGADCRLCMIQDADHGRSVFWCRAVTDTVIEFVKSNCHQH
ncbi:MAG: alpha/beta hydrolase [Erysipelotrichaceae bacterium]|nr:alpha/beta hydrolase [Erysipelotrichaceae bacterium]